MKSIELIHKSGPHGDECSSYELKFNEQMTVREFLQKLPEEEWGNVYVNIPNPDTWDCEYAAEHERWMRINISYAEYGTLKNIPYEFRPYLDSKIDIHKSATAYGGWGCMDYNLCVEPI